MLAEQYSFLCVILQHYKILSPNVIMHHRATLSLHDYDANIAKLYIPYFDNFEGATLYNNDQKWRKLCITTAKSLN